MGINMTDRYAVIGNPISHSRSPRIHRAFALDAQQDMSYEAILSPLEGFRQVVTDFFAFDEGKGLNITLPFKGQAYEMSEVKSSRATQAGAVNTLMKGKDGRIYGDNTDGVGLVRDMTQNLGWTLEGKRILVVGAGGAVRGVLGTLLAQNPSQLWIVNRTYSKAQNLANIFRAYGNIDALRFDEIATQSVDGKSELPFLVWAKAQGATVSDGLGMLVEQAAESFFIWRGVHVASTELLSELRAELS